MSDGGTEDTNIDPEPVNYQALINGVRKTKRSYYKKITICISIWLALLEQ